MTIILPYDVFDCPVKDNIAKLAATMAHDQESLSFWLCNRLHEMLEAKIYKLNRRDWADWCSFCGRGKVFAWVWHNRQKDSIIVFFLGELQQATERRLRATELSPARKKIARWKGFGGSVKVCNESELRNVARFLVLVSHEQSFH
jgi:hypothetical protein